MELRHLATFRTVAATLNFTRSAHQLGYVQTNVSAHIQVLEQELGVRLFDRLGKKIALTEAGRTLLPYAERLLALQEEAKGVVTAHQAPQGTVRIGGPESICTYRLAPMLRALQANYPLVHPHFGTGPVATLIQRVREGSVDLGFLLDQPISMHDLACQILAEEPVVLVSNRDHPLAPSSAVAPRDLERLTLLATEAGCAYRMAFEQEMGKEGVQLGEIIEFSSIEAIKQCVKAGMGYSVLPRMAVQRELADDELVEWTWVGQPLTMQFQIVWHAQKWRSPALQAVIDTASHMRWP